MEDLNEILHFRPDHASALYHRGLIHVRLGDRGAAITDFADVLRLVPDHAAAASRLRGLLVELHETCTKTDDSALSSAETLVDAPVLPQSPAPELTEPTCSEEPAVEIGFLTEPESRPQPVTEAPVRKPPKPKENRIRIKCPHCGYVGTAPWGNLGNVLECFVCKRNFAVDGGGEAVVIKSNRRKQAATLIPTQIAGSHRKLIIAAMVILALSPLVYFARGTAQSTEELREPDLPKELASRAELFAKAWSKGDIRTLKRLTVPEHEKAVFTWFNAHKPCGPTLSEAQVNELKVSTTIESADPKGTLVKAAIPGQKPLTTMWEERGSTWYFMPPKKK